MSAGILSSMMWRYNCKYHMSTKWVGDIWYLSSICIRLVHHLCQTSNNLYIYIFPSLEPVEVCWNAASFILPKGISSWVFSSRAKSARSCHNTLGPETALEAPRSRQVGIGLSYGALWTLTNAHAFRKREQSNSCHYCCRTIAWT